MIFGLPEIEFWREEGRESFKTWMHKENGSDFEES